MPENQKPTTIEAFTPDGEATVLFQTGFDVIDKTILKMVSHYKAQATSATILTDQWVLADNTSMNNAADLIKNTNSGNDFLTTDDNDKDMPGILAYIFELQRQAMTYVNSQTKWSVPDMSSSHAEITRFYLDMENALLGYPVRMVDEAGATVTTVADACKGLGWRATGADTERRHWTMVRRYVIMMGTMWRNTLPKFNERFESMDDTQITRTVWMYLCAAIYALCDFPYLAAGQSEVAVLNEGFTVKNLFNPKVPNISVALDKLWAWYAEPHKSVDTVPAGHTQYTTSPIDTSRISIAGQQVSTSDDALKSLELVYKVSSHALVWARQMFGIGKYNAREETVNFGILMDLAHAIITDVATGLVRSQYDLITNHGTTRWCVGANLAILLKYLEDVSTIRAAEWEKALSHRKHWSYEDIEAWSKSIFVDFSVKSSLAGLCEDSCYKGIRAQVRFTTYAVPFVTSIFSDPTTLVTTNDFTAATKLNASARGMYPIIGGNKLVDKLYNLHYQGEWTENEMLMDMRYSLLLSRTYGSNNVGADDFERIWAVRTRLVQMIGAYAEEKKARETVALMSSDAEELRFESTEDVLKAANGATQIKYSSTVNKVKPDVAVIRSASRLVGEGHGVQIKNWFGFQSHTDEWLVKIAMPITIKKTEPTPIEKKVETTSAEMKPPTAKNEGNNPKSDTVG